VFFTIGGLLYLLPSFWGWQTRQSTWSRKTVFGTMPSRETLPGWRRPSRMRKSPRLAAPRDDPGSRGETRANRRRVAPPAASAARPDATRSG
jgi:hypothetical protein